MDTFLGRFCTQKGAAGWLLACGVTEGRMDGVVVKPEAMMMDGSRSTSLLRFVSLSWLFSELLAVFVGWMHWSR